MSQSITESEEVGRDSTTSYGTGALESEYTEGSVAEIGVGNPSNDQNSTPWYRRKRYWAICVTINIILLIILLPLLFLVIFPAIAQSTISKSIITFDSLSMHLPMNETHFGLDTVGTISNGGSFSATVSFPNGAQMVYNDTVIGELTLPTVSVSGGNGNVSSSTIVHIVNSDRFADFVKAQMNDQNLTFTLKASVTVKSLGITKSGLDLNKAIMINGTNGFRDPGAVSIIGFQVGQDDPSTLTSVVTVNIKNPSPVSVFLGTLGVHNIYENVTLGPSTAQGLTLASGLNTITLNGTVTKKSPDEQYAMNDFLEKLTTGQPIDLISVGDFAKPDGINEISWLSTGVKALSLSATLQMNKSDLVQGVELGNMTLKFTNDSAYAPKMSTSGSKVAYKLPFNISFLVENVAQNLTILYQDTPLAIYNASWTNATNDSTDIILSMPEGPLTVLDGQDDLFQSFLKNVTLADVVSFKIVGSSGVQGETAISPVQMDGISFNVPVQMKGLGGLKTPTNITKFTVNGGTKEALLVGIEAVLWNPSDGTLLMGDVGMAIKFQDVQVGNMLLPNFTITPGLNTINASGTFQPNDTPQGRYLLSAFLNRTSSVLTMGGYPGCSDIASLVPALESLNSSAILPGLNQDLVSNVALTVHNDTAQTKIVGTTMVFNNIFATSISMFNIQASITSNDGLPVGSINLDLSKQPLVVPPSTNFTFPELPVLLNLDPNVMFSLLRKAAVAQNMDVRPLDALLKLGNITVDGADPNANPEPSIFANFNLNDFVIQALHQMPLHVQLTAAVSLEEYQTILGYGQNITATTDKSIALLIPILGAPIVQTLVSKTTTHFDKIFLHDLSDTSFKGDISGLISNTGPFSATISFPTGVKVSTGGKLLGTMNMADVTSNDNVAQINTTAEFLIADADALGQFSIQLLGTDSAEWDIAADSMIVEAMGVPFNNITLSQTVQLQGSNGFKGQVQVLDVKMPGVAPEGGIAMDLTISLFNPGTVGLDPGSIQFNSFYKNVSVGPASSSSAILPDANNTMTLSGRITPKTDPNDIAVISELFSLFITGNDVPIDSVGAGVVPASGSCKWLSQAITHLTIPIVLPAPKVQLIQGVTIGNLNMTFTPETAYAPLTSSSDTEATFFNPFGFPMFPQAISQDLTIINNNVPMVQASIPQGPVRLNPPSGVISTFSNIPFTVISGQEDNFNGFVGDLTINKNKTFTLQGKVNATTLTPSGIFNIQGIQFNVQTTVPGLQGLQSAPITLSNVTVKGGTKDFLDISVTVGITNPSTIQVSTGDVALDVFVGQSFVGQTILNNLVLASGQNNIPAQFRYQPSPDVLAGVGADLLGAFLENKSTGLTIKGNPKSTNIASLAPTFSLMTLSSALDGIDGQILKAINVSVKLTDPTNALMTVVIHNPLDANFIPVNFVAIAFLNGTKDQVGISNITSLPPIPVPAKGEITAPNLPFKITMSLAKLQPIVVKNGGKLPVDVQLTTTTNIGQYTPIINYFQPNIVTTVIIA